MDDILLSTQEAAEKLGISTTTLYDWLAQSDAGSFRIRGQSVTIDYYQGGPKGQGRIKIEATEVERLKELMRVKPRIQKTRRPPKRVENYPGITVKLGRPGAA